jgi:hypothetical protein
VTTEIKTDGNYFSEKWTAIKEKFTDSDSLVSKTISSGKAIVNESKETVKKVEGNYISKKWKSTKGMFVDSDSVINARKTTYFDYQKNNYPEYQSVQKWFESNPKELLNLKGDYYKMLKGAVLDEGTIIHKDLTVKSELGTYKYLYVTEEAYFIYDLTNTANEAHYKSVRRIQKGIGKEPMHDLEFDKRRNLKREKFQGEVKQDLFTKDGHIFFEYKKKVNGNSVVNTIDLGTERNF